MNGYVMDLKETREEAVPSYFKVLSQHYEEGLRKSTETKSAQLSTSVIQVTCITAWANLLGDVLYYLQYY